MDWFHFIDLGNLVMDKLSLLFLLTEWFYHVLDFVGVCLFDSENFVTLLTLIINMWAPWLVLRPSLSRLKMVGCAAHTFTNFV